ncbi:MAG: transporter substrate-binding domain-containing protein [Rhodospirillales bacterium]|jgi:polar amino acid transport system substrate-binding protein|nr:transporter substrate-binding domain-containing protein [Rhodospirillales bacterium]
MKSLRKFHPIAALVIGLAVLFAGPSADAKAKIRVVYNTEPNHPFITGKGTKIDAERPGLTIDLLHEVSRQIGIEFEFKRVPWRRALFMVEAGQADAVFHSSFKTERTTFGAYPVKNGMPDETRKIADFSYHIYTTKKYGVSWDGKVIGNARRPIGVMRGAAMFDILKNAGHKVDDAISSAVNLRKLVGGRICAYVDLEGVVDPNLSAHPEWLEIVQKLSPPIRTQPYFLMFSKAFADSQPELTERVWDAIGDFRKSPQFETLKKKYGLL